MGHHKIPEILLHIITKSYLSIKFIPFNAVLDTMIFVVLPLVEEELYQTDITLQTAYLQHKVTPYLAPCTTDLTVEYSYTFQNVNPLGFRKD
jgi:hypothetical protein